MVGTILPIGYGADKRGRGLTVLGIYLGGSLLGAVLLGAGLGWIGLLLRGAVLHFLDATGDRFLVIGAISELCAAGEIGLLPIPVAGTNWQVPANWRALQAQVMGFAYGLVLGWSVTTRIIVRSFYTVALWALLSLDPITGAWGLLGFGLGRALPMIWLRCHFRTLEELELATQSVAGLLPVVHLINGVALAFVGSALASTWLPS